MNKRGFLLGEETIKIIVAVLGIIILIGLLTSLYFTQVKNKDLVQAESTLSELMAKIDVAKRDGSSKVLLFFPEDWIIASFSQGESQPKTCGGNCLCVCPEPWLKRKFNEKCGDKGVCSTTSDKINSDRIEIEAKELMIEYKRGEIFINE